MRIVNDLTEYTARKEYTCYHCGGTISKGEKYYSIIVEEEGVLKNLRYCKTCDEELNNIAKNVLEEQEEDIMEEELPF